MITVRDPADRLALLSAEQLRQILDLLSTQPPITEVLGSMTTPDWGNRCQACIEALWIHCEHGVTE